MCKLSFAGLELTGKYSELLPMQRVLKENGIGSTLWEVEYFVSSVWVLDTVDSELLGKTVRLFTGSLSDCKEVARLRNELEGVYTAQAPEVRYIVHDGKNIIE